MFGLLPLTIRGIRSITAAQERLDADLDFYTPTGQHVNRSDILKYSGLKVGAKMQVRYGLSLQKTGMLTLTAPANKDSRP